MAERSLIRRALDFVAVGDKPTEVRLRETPEPLEGTRMSLFNSQIPDFWTASGLSSSSRFIPGNAELAHRVWVANRCIQMNSQQIAAMPVEFFGPDAGTPPQWTYNPDPNWFPNGISDAIFAIVENIYGWGYACIHVLTRYADGFPRTWTVLNNRAFTIEEEGGRRVYKLNGGNGFFDPFDIIQIDRNPGRLHGSSAIRAYAQVAWGLLAAGNQSLMVNQGGVAKFYLKSSRKLTEAQAEKIQQRWMERVTSRDGAPPVVPPEITPEEMSFNPSDLALLDTQEFNARALCTAFGVPSVLLNLALQGGLTYQNPAALGEMWWRFELRNTSKRIADAMSAQMLARGSRVELKAEDTFAPLVDTAQDEDDTQRAQDEPVPLSSSASPAAQLTAIGGGNA